MQRSVARAVVALAVPGLLGSCYSYRPLVSAPPAASRVAVVLTDNGRAETANRIGPQTARVEGAVLAASDTAYLLSISAVQPISGALVRWNGETVSVRRDQIAVLYERRISPSRTAIIVGAVTGLLALTITTDLFGFGGADIAPLPGGDNPGQDQ
jgi:hypothetical protein